MGRVFFIFCMVFSYVGFGIPVEKPAISGAEFRVKQYPDAPIGQFSRSETTIRAHNFLFSNRGWQYGTWAKDAGRVKNLPNILLGLKYYELPVQESLDYEFLSDGEVLAVAHVIPPLDVSKELEKLGFERVKEIAPFKLITDLDRDAVGVFRKRVKAGESFKSPKPWILLAGLNPPEVERSGETLYNGIVIPRKWPPRYEDPNGEFYPDGYRVMPVPYLEKKPKLIEISIGRQLFVDDFLIAKGDFEREYHLPVPCEGNPVLTPQNALEMGKCSPFSSKVKSVPPAAAPVSGGLWWNPDKGVYEVWYNAGWHGTMGYAYSKDLKNWTRPNLGLYDEPNQIMPDKMFIDSGAVFFDRNEPEPAKLYKNFNRGGLGHNRGMLWTSPDGVTFDYDSRVLAGISGDRSTVNYNPFRKKWIFSLRWNSINGRHRAYVEADDFIKGSRWTPDEPVYWLNVDKNDLPDPQIGVKPSLYDVDTIAYESIMLGFVMVWLGPENDVCLRNGHPKYTEIKFAYSRDGFHFSRGNYAAAIKSQKREGAWDRGYVQPVNGGLVVDGDKLYIFYVGVKGDGKSLNKKNLTGEEICSSTGMHAYASMGRMQMRRDGFASLNSKPDKAAEILTEPVKFAGSFLFANIEAPDGALYAEVLDMQGRVIEPFSFANCIPAKGDSTAAMITWKGAKDIGRLAHAPVRFRFKMENGKFYSFWVSVSENGRSDGYVGAGGPKYPMGVDTVGSN